MKVNKAGTKAILTSVLLFTDDKDTQGKQERRSSIYHKVYRGYSSLKTKLLNDMEVSVKEGEWIKATEAKDKPILAEKFINGELEITESELEAVKHYAKERKELPEVDITALDEYEALIK